MADGSMNEFSIYRTASDSEWEVSFPTGTRLKNTILRLAEKHPGEVQNLIVNKDGSVFATIPVDWVKIRPKKTVTDSQREQAKQNLARFHAEH